MEVVHVCRNGAGIWEKNQAPQIENSKISSETSTVVDEDQPTNADKCHGMLLMSGGVHRCALHWKNGRLHPQISILL